MQLDHHVAVRLVTKLDPDGTLRDLIDAALQRYHQRRSVDDGTPPPMNDERPDDGTASHDS